MTGTGAGRRRSRTTVEFATKPLQARTMLERAIAAGVPFSWFTADEAYGQNPGLRTWLEEQDVSYVMATRCDDEVASGLFTTTRVDALIAKVPARCVDSGRPAATGHTGPACMTGPRVPIRREFGTDRRGWVLARRSITDPTDIAYYVCYGPRGTRLRELVRVAGARWAVEESFQTAKNEVGLDNYQVRRYDAWYAHITLAMAAAAFLAATRAIEAEKGAAIPTQTRSSRLSSNEIRRLYGKLVLKGQTGDRIRAVLVDWRRRRQAQARASHYRKRHKQTLCNDFG